MAAKASETASLDQLCSEEQVHLLDVVESLRAQGLSQHLDLPQLIVCGDQSSGKSSVLEGLTRVRFPTKDTVCTTFATELVLRKASKQRITATIRAGNSRNPDERRRLNAFQENLTSPDEFANVVDKARKHMQSHPWGTASNSFFDDVLKVELSGPDYSSLTIVDLPGLIHDKNENQIDKDVETVQNMVKGYMKKENSIIMAVVSAQNERAGQIVLRYARAVDEFGFRTLGIITKPDKLDVGSGKEDEYFKLAQGKLVNFSLGWHVVVNRDFTRQNDTDLERDHFERKFWSTGVWKSIPQAHRGIDSLRGKLSRVLLGHIRAKLPSLLNKIDVTIEESTVRREHLGDPRVTKEAQQKFLNAKSRRFEDLTKSALNGWYRDAFFKQSTTDENTLDWPKKLRARIQDVSHAFADVMYQKGHNWNIVDDSQAETISHQRNAPSLPSTATSQALAVFTARIEDPHVISRSTFLRHINQIACESRGLEMHLTISPLVIGEVFRRQSGKWKQLGQIYLAEVQRVVKMFLDRCLESMMDRRTQKLLMMEHMDVILEERRRRVEAKLEELLTPFQYHDPVAYDRLFVDNVEASRSKRYAEETNRQRSTKASASGDLLLTNNHDSTQEFANSEILSFMQAYYKVAISTFISNVIVLAAENCLLADLADTFSSKTVLEMDDAKLRTITAESRDIEVERTELDQKITDLRVGKQIIEHEACLAPDGFQSGSSEERKEALDAPRTPEIPLTKDEVIEDRVEDITSKLNTLTVTPNKNTRPRKRATPSWASTLTPASKSSSSTSSASSRRSTSGSSTQWRSSGYASDDSEPEMTEVNAAKDDFPSLGHSKMNNVTPSLFS